MTNKAKNCSTAADYLTFCRALLNRGELGGVRLLGPKTLALMTTNHLPRIPSLHAYGGVSRWFTDSSYKKFKGDTFVDGSCVACRHRSQLDRPSTRCGI